VPHHLLLDAAAFLGAVARPQRGLCARGRADAAGGCRREGDAPADPDLFARARADRRLAVAPRLRRAGLWHGCDRERRRVARACLAAVAHAVRAHRQAAVCVLDPLSLRAVCRAPRRVRRRRPVQPYLRMSLAMSEQPEEPGIVLTEEQKRRRRARSIAIALALGAFVIVIYLVTVVKLGPDVLRRPL